MGEVATHAPGATRKRPWLIFLRPKWLCWHAFAVVAFAGMIWLGAWQFQRAESGNDLSWAYTFEWPLFALFGLYFWGRTIRDELRGISGAAAPASDSQDDGAAEPTETAEAYQARLLAEARATHGKRR